MALNCIWRDAEILDSPYLFAGVVVVIIILAIVGCAYFVRSRN